jgi:hypothetical protein
VGNEQRPCQGHDSDTRQLHSVRRSGHGEYASDERETAASSAKEPPRSMRLEQSNQFATSSSVRSTERECPGARIGLSYRLSEKRWTMAGRPRRRPCVRIEATSCGGAGGPVIGAVDDRAVLKRRTPTVDRF